jgi:hypothetical protein
MPELKKPLVQIFELFFSCCYLPVTNVHEYINCRNGVNFFKLISCMIYIPDVKLSSFITVLGYVPALGIFAPQ